MKKLLLILTLGILAITQTVDALYVEAHRDGHYHDHYYGRRFVGRRRYVGGPFVARRPVARAAVWRR